MKACCCGCIGNRGPALLIESRSRCNPRDTPRSPCLYHHLLDQSGWLISLIVFNLFMMIALYCLRFTLPMGEDMKFHFGVLGRDFILLSSPCVIDVSCR